MTKTKKDYKHKCKQKVITFYNNDYDKKLYAYSCSINFQKFCKDKLGEAYLHEVMGVDYDN